MSRNVLSIRNKISSLFLARGLLYVRVHLLLFVGFVCFATIRGNIRCVGIWTFATAAFAKIVLGRWRPCGVFSMDVGPSRKQFSPGPKERVDLTKFLTNRPTFPSNPIKKWQRESENAGERERCGLATFSNVRSASSRARRCWLGLTFKHSLYGPKNRPG